MPGREQRLPEAARIAVDFVLSWNESFFLGSEDWDEIVSLPRLLSIRFGSIGIVLGSEVREFGVSYAVDFLDLTTDLFRQPFRWFLGIVFYFNFDEEVCAHSLAVN